ncbi:MAG: hypothetical protein NVSMB56_10590 [Pyrinomonadaceae bacterium]
MIGKTYMICALVSLLIPAMVVCQISTTPPAIQDNSFLIEEAYNQEAGIIQHISTFMRQRGGNWIYTFTQELPLGSQRHQFSYTLAVPHNRDANDTRQTGLGDLALNYRYQLIGNGETRLAVAPRVTILLPTGDSKKDLGAGGAGVQFNIPVSIVLTKRFVTHVNAGTTFYHAAKNAAGERATRYDYNLGQSIVWLAKPRFNPLLEASYSRTQNVVGIGQTKSASTLLLSPGVRWAYNFRNGLQIVPGIAVPLGVGPSRGERGVFFYLSFEHPFKKQRAAPVGEASDAK